MNFLKNFNKKISCLLIISILAVNLSFLAFPQKTKAVTVLGTGTSAEEVWFIANGVQAAAFYNAAVPATAAFQAKQLAAPSIWNILEQDGVLPALQAIAEDIARQIIQNITEATVNWINNGFNGQPAYVSNIGNFLANTADQTIGEELLNSDLNFLCTPFQLQVKLALNLSYSQPYYKQIGCTLTGAIANATNAVNDFTSAEGWNNWLQMSTNPQNNPIGAFLIAQNHINTQVAARQASALAEVSIGQGALSYKDCVETTKDSNGELVSTREYLGSDFLNASANVTLPNGKNIVNTNTPANTTNTTNKTTTECTTKTPGAVITNMLGFSATSDVRVTELQAALSNGIDQVLGSLANALIKKGLSALQNGVLGNNSTTNADYNSQLNSILQQTQTQYNQTAQQVQNPNYTPDYNLGSQLNQYDTFLGNNYSSGFNPTPETATTTNGQSISPSDPFYSEKTNSISIINSILNFEYKYQDVYDVALNILSAGRDVFNSAKNCNIALGDPASYSRALSINANVISNIDRTVNYSKTIPQIPWSLPALDSSMILSNSHVDILNNAQDTIISATAGDTISSEMDIINGTNFNADQPLANMISNIKAWFTQMSIMYTTAQCPIDLTSALTGNAPAQSEGATSSTVTSGSFLQ